MDESQRKSARFGAAVATVQIAAVALVAILSWEVQAKSIAVQPVERIALVGRVPRRPPDQSAAVAPIIAALTTPLAGLTLPESVATRAPEPAKWIRPTPNGPSALNGVTVDQFLKMPDGVWEHAREIFERGQAMGNDPRAFSKLGDSTVESPYFLSRFDEGYYDLGEYAHLQNVIDYYSGSFGRLSVTVRRGFHSWSALDPFWADSQYCLDGESPLACEFRLNRPSILLIRLGSNDATAPATFERHMREIVAFTIAQGVVPVLGTKADRFEGAGNEINLILRKLADEFRIPLWDFDLVAQTAPGRVLGQDGVHLTSFYAHDYTSPEAFQMGHSLHNLSALLVLDRLATTFSPLDLAREGEQS